MKHRPFPEIVSGEHNWEVFEDDNHPRTDMTNRKMYVPLDDDCHKCGLQHSRMIRRHELGHVKWSPRSYGKLKQGVMEEAVHLLEEIRINHLLTMHHIPMSEPHRCIEEVQAQTRHFVEKGSVADLLKWTIACAFVTETPKYSSGWFRYNMYKHIMNGNSRVKVGHELEETLKAMKVAIDSNTLTPQRIADLEFVVEQAEYFHKVMVTVSTKSNNFSRNVAFSRVKKYAPHLSDILRMFNEKPTQDEVFLSEDDKRKIQEILDDEDFDGDMEDAYAEAGVGQVDDLKSLERRNSKDKRELMLSFPQRGKKPTWGKMTIHTPACSINLSNKLRQGYTTVGKDYGTNPNRIHRYTVDKKVFSRKQKIYGGTVLIDASGSMSFNGEDLLEVMQELPAVTIAMYNGRFSEGDLRIIARNGRRVNDQYLYDWVGRGNMIDLPALEWLGQQEPKRLWVSDMQVVPPGGTSKEALQECIDAMNKYHITRLADISEVKQFAKMLNVLK
jgi:hypothetical protein